MPEPRCRLWPTFGERGYALPLVLLGIAIFLVYAGESASRSVREARIATVMTNSEIAYYAAEAGFNRARARLIGGANRSQMEDLNGRSETLKDSTGQDGGTYALVVETVNEAAGVYRVVSTGTYGDGDYQARRVVAGTISLIDVAAPRRVNTAYDK